ncbi:MAG: hypothetical protein WCV81_00230 [Microgenomates group bacterium]|jgi:hypothetical protein
MAEIKNSKTEAVAETVLNESQFSEITEDIKGALDHLNFGPHFEGDFAREENERFKEMLYAYQAGIAVGMGKRKPLEITEGGRLKTHGI